VHYRTIFLSDTHLGTRGCAAAQLYKFLKENDAETIYLLGDIIDIWRLSVRFYWPHSHIDVVRRLLQMSRKDIKVVYIPGNHDEKMRAFCGLSFGNIDICMQSEHITAGGKKLLLLHGDEFDYVTSRYRWVAVLGDHGYTLCLALNRWINALRRRCGIEPWSLATYVKRSIKEAVKVVSQYESALQTECKQRGFDGIVCGHIHTPALKIINGLLYCNCGDTVESCTVVVEDFNGNLMIMPLNQSHPTHIYSHDGRILTREQHIPWLEQRQTSPQDLSG
jgi:UDP-2,3-diacylglucosamine pyrophosphatase LpxH